MNRKIIYILVCFLFNFLWIFSQSDKDNLLDKRDKLSNDILLTSKLIEATEKKKGSTIQSLRLLNLKISKRFKLIQNYNTEIKLIEGQIVEKESTIVSLKGDLVEQRKLYASFLQYTYKNTNYYSQAVYLLASENLNQFYLRKKYLEQLHSARKEKIALILAIEKRISLEIDELNLSKLELGEALLKTRQENIKFKREKNNRNGVLSRLTLEEKDLRDELNEKRKIEKEITRRIEELIRAEAKKSSFARLTPEEQLVSDDFERNRGILPWPTRQGIITEKFGEHYHPVIKGVKVRNNGIDISTINDSGVRTIFGGEVSKIFAIKGSNYTVIIRHGKFYTVYHNLDKLTVNIGDIVNTKELIGYVARSKMNDNSIIHFEIWNGLEKLNPEDWISD